MIKQKGKFGDEWSRITKKYRCGAEIIGGDLEFVLESCSLSTTYKTNATKKGVKVRTRLIPIARGRKVRMICLEIGKFRQPISKSKIIDQIFPKKLRRSSKKLKSPAVAVRSAMRLVIEYQISEYRNSIEYPFLCPLSKEKIYRGGKIDIDHFDKPFVQIADEFLLEEGLVYDQITLQGPPTAKRFKDKELAKRWMSFHEKNCVLRAVSSSKNRSKGSQDYSSPESLHQKDKDSIDLNF